MMISIDFIDMDSSLRCVCMMMQKTKQNKQNSDDDGDDYV